MIDTGKINKMLGKDKNKEKVEKILSDLDGNDQKICIREVNENLRRVRCGQELTKPLAQLNKVCEFREKYDEAFDIWEREKIREEINTYQRKYYRKNKNKKRAYHRDYNRKRVGHRKNYCKKYYLKNKDRLSFYQKTYRAANREKINANARAYRRRKKLKQNGKTKQTESN